MRTPAKVAISWPSGAVVGASCVPAIANEARRIKSPYFPCPQRQHLAFVPHALGAGQQETACQARVNGARLECAAMTVCGPCTPSDRRSAARRTRRRTS